MMRIRYTLMESRSLFDDNTEQSVDSIKDHASAFAWFLDYLQRKNAKSAVVASEVDPERIGFVCHRGPGVHGGDFQHPIVVTKESYEDI